MNTHKKNKIFNPVLYLISLTIAVALILGCAAGKNADLKQPESRRIVDIAISETTDSILFIISGDRSLEYKAEKQISPLGVVIRFGNTSMDIFERVYIPPENEIIRSITADSVVEDNADTSYIFVELKKDAPYDVTTSGNTLHVAFSKAPAPLKASEARTESAAAKPLAESAPGSTAVATRLNRVTVTPQKNDLVVMVDADGTIKNYKRFSMRNPARIVVDMYGVKSPNKREEIITVESEWLKQARYYGHPEKVRLVLHTYPQYLYKYTVHPSNSGLIIRIGGDKTVASEAAVAQQGKSEIVLGNESGGRHITLKWDSAPNATSYNLYWRNSPGVTKRNGKKITNVENPVKISGLKTGMTYYFVVTTVSGNRESDISEEMPFAVDE